MTWSIQEVGRMTGLTSRTLRHYHAIGLLPPADTAVGGRRYYGTAELERLQEILLLRALGLSLAAIGEALDVHPARDRVKVLQKHRAHLAKERERYDRLLATVDLTIHTLKEGNTMAPEKMFDGLIHNPYEDEAREAWGDAAVDASTERLRQADPELREALTSGRGFTALHDRLAKLKLQGVAVEDARVQAVIGEHHNLIRVAWTPNRAAYLGLAQMYVDDARFRQNIGQGDDELVSYLRDAMGVYAATLPEA